MATQIPIVLALFALASPAADYRGKVIRVIDGDTLVVSRGHQAERIRLQGIDAPELRQAFGPQARQFTAAAASGRVVTVRERGRDRYGRTLAIVAVRARILNRELVAAGLAWHYRQYSSDAVLARLERQARARRRGLWADPHPIAPWDFRRAGPPERQR